MLAPLRVGHAVDGGFGDLGHFQQHVDDFLGVDILAAGDDERILAAAQVEIAVLVEIAHVVREIPAVADHVRGLFRHLIVAEHHALPAHADLALLTGIAQRAVRPHDAHGGAGQRPSDRGEIPSAEDQVILREQRRDGAGHLRHAVGLIKAAVEPVERAPQQIRGNGAGGVVDDLQVRQVVVFAVHLIEDALQDQRDDADSAHLFPHETLHIVAHGEVRDHDELTAGRQREIGAGARGVE